MTFPLINLAVNEFSYYSNLKIIPNRKVNVDKCVSYFLIYPRIPQWHSILMSYIIQNAQLPYLIHKNFQFSPHFVGNSSNVCLLQQSYFLLLKCTSSCDTSTSKNLSFKIENTRKMYQKNENGGEEAT